MNLLLLIVSFSAMAYEVGIIGKNGDTVQAFQKNGKIIVKKCEDYTILTKGQECSGKVIQPPITKDEFLYKAYLSVIYHPPSELSTQVKQILDGSEKVDLQKLNKLKEKKSNIDTWASTYGKENINHSEYNAIVKEIKQIEDFSRLNIFRLEAIETVKRKLEEIYNDIVNPDLLISGDSSLLRDHVLKNFNPEHESACTPPPPQGTIYLLAKREKNFFIYSYMANEKEVKDLSSKGWILQGQVPFLSKAHNFAVKLSNCIMGSEFMVGDSCISKEKNSYYVRRDHVDEIMKLPGFSLRYLKLSDVRLCRPEVRLSLKDFIPSSSPDLVQSTTNVNSESRGSNNKDEKDKSQSLPAIKNATKQ